jgi:hypothetical protein
VVAAAAAWKLIGQVSISSCMCLSTFISCTRGCYIGWSNVSCPPQYALCLLLQEEHQAVGSSYQVAGSRMRQQQLGQGLQPSRRSSST